MLQEKSIRGGIDLKRASMFLSMLIVAAMLVGCGETGNSVKENVKQTEAAGETEIVGKPEPTKEPEPTEEAESVGEPESVEGTEIETVTEELGVNEETIEEIKEKGSRQNPYKLGEKAILNVFVNGVAFDELPATMEIVMSEYSEKYVECEFALTNFESDSAVEIGYTFYPKIINSQMAEIQVSFITQEPELWSPNVSMYGGGQATGYIELKGDDEKTVPQYVVLQYYQCTDASKPLEESDWTETWFELSTE